MRQLETIAISPKNTRKQKPKGRVFACTLTGQDAKNAANTKNTKTLRQKYGNYNGKLQSAGKFTFDRGGEKGTVYVQLPKVKQVTKKAQPVEFKVGPNREK